MAYDQGSGSAPPKRSQHSPGERIGDYILVENRGAGGMGEVWEAQGPTGQLVALKLMHEHWAGDMSMVLRFRREFDVGYRIRHPNLIQMVTYDPSHMPPYLVMQLARGKSLRRLVDLGGPFREREVAVIGAQVGDALAELNRQGVVHRDLKSSNIMVDRDLRAVLIDFGIARLDGEATISSGDVFIGSAEYASPEAYLGKKATAKSDVYSAGIVLYEALTGAVPFRSDRYSDTLRMQAEHPVPRVSERNASVSEAMDDLVFSMLQKQPGRRPSAQEFAARCRTIAEMHGVAFPAADAPPRPAGQRPGPAPAAGVPDPLASTVPVAPLPPPQASPNPVEARAAVVTTPADATPPPPAATPPIMLFIAIAAAAVMAVTVVLAIAGAQ